MPATAMPNGGPSPQNLEGVYTAIYLILSRADPRLAQEFQKFVTQSEYVQERYHPSFSAHATQSYEEMLREEQATQKLIDQVFQYVAPSLFVTSVLASGELVGSTIWGISKYVSKDIIWNTLGATTAAVILQSADLVGYKDKAQKLFGIKNTERRATLAITIGGQVGKALGAVAGTALSISIEAAAVGVVAPTLLPLVIGIGSFTGQRIGEVVGVGLGAGLNNLFFSTIGTLPASYKGIKQKGGKFVERIKRSSEEKHKRAQKANSAAVAGLGESGASPSSVVASGTGVSRQDAGNNSPIPQSPANLAIVQHRRALPSSAAPAISPAERVVQNASQEPAGAGPQAPAVNQPPAPENKESLQRPQAGQDNGARKKKRRKKTQTKTQTNIILSQTTNTINKSQDGGIAPSTTDLNETGWTTIPTQKELNAKKKLKAAEAKNNSKSYTGNPDVRIIIKKKNSQEVNSQEKQHSQLQSNKFTTNIQPKNVVSDAIQRGEQNKGKTHAKKPHNKSGGDRRISGKERSKN